MSKVLCSGTISSSVAFDNNPLRDA